MSCDVGLRCGSDLALLWLWCRPAATALIRPLAWEPPYALGAPKKTTTKKYKDKETTQAHHVKTPKTKYKNKYLNIFILMSAEGKK